MANERGRLYDPDGATATYLLNDKSNKKSIIKEENFLETKLKNKTVIGTTSSSTVFETVSGKLRKITVTGSIAGTQTEIEAFLNPLDAWANETGFTDNWYYYPLIHPSNTLGGTGGQNQYYNVIPESFNWSITHVTGGIICEYTISFMEGQKVLDFLS